CLWLPSWPQVPVAGSPPRDGGAADAEVFSRPPTRTGPGADVRLDPVSSAPVADTQVLVIPCVVGRRPVRRGGRGGSWRGTGLWGLGRAPVGGGRRRGWRRRAACGRPGGARRQGRPRRWPRRRRRWP